MKKLFFVATLWGLLGCDPTYQREFSLKNAGTGTISVRYLTEKGDSIQENILQNASLSISQKTKPGYTSQESLGDSVPNFIHILSLRKDTLPCKKYWKNGRLWERIEEEDEAVKYIFHMGDSDF